jgi:hypothetical protein
MVLRSVLLQHADYLNDPNGRRYDWCLTDWSSAVRTALGRRALLLFRGAFAALLGPAVVLAVYGLYSNKPTLVIFSFLGLWGFWTSSTRPTGIGAAASLLVAFVGVLCGVILGDRLLLFSAVLRGIIWFASCAIDFVPRLLLLGTPDFFFPAINADERLIAVEQRRAAGVVGGLFG